MDRFTQYAVAAAKMAVADAKLEITEENSPRIGVWIDLVLAVWKHTKNNLRFLLRKYTPRRPILRADDDSRYGSRSSINRNRSKRN